VKTLRDEGANRLILLEWSDSIEQSLEWACDDYLGELATETESM